MRTFRAALFGPRDPGLIDVRLQRDAFGRRDSGRTKGAADGIAIPDSGCNRFRKLLTVGSILSVRGLSWVSKKTALDEYGWHIRSS